MAQNIPGMVPVTGPNGLVVYFPIGADAPTIKRGMKRAMQQQGEPAPDRISGAFEAAQPVRQLDQLREPRSGLVTTSDRFGDPHFGGALGDVWDAVTTVGDVAASRKPAMVPDTGQGVTNPDVEVAAKTIAKAALPVSPAFRAGEMAIPGMMRAPLRRPEAPVPTRQELTGAYKAGRKEAMSMGVDYHVPTVANMASTIRAELERDGLNALTAPKTIKTIRMLENPPSDPSAGISLEGIDTARQTLGNIAGKNAKDKLAAKRAIEALDRFAENPPPGSVVGGPLAVERAQQAGDIMSEARSNYAAGMRSKRLEKQQREAELNAAAANSGMNIDNSLRQKVNTILKSETLSAGFTPAEIREMELFAAGKTHARNVQRHIGNLLGGGQGLGANVTAGVGSAIAGGLGFKLAGPVGIGAATIPPIMGYGLKASANRAAKRGMNELGAMIRRRSPLYEQRLALSPTAPLRPEVRAAALRALMADPPETLLDRRRYLGGPLIR